MVEKVSSTALADVGQTLFLVDRWTDELWRWTKVQLVEVSQGRVIGAIHPDSFQEAGTRREDPAYQATWEAFMVFVTARVRRRIVLVGDSLGSGL